MNGECREGAPDRAQRQNDQTQATVIGRRRYRCMGVSGVDLNAEAHLEYPAAHIPMIAKMVRSPKTVPNPAPSCSACRTERTQQRRAAPIAPDHRRIAKFDLIR